jgi:hypothetical protein
LDTPLMARSWGRVSQGDEEYLAVGTCSMLAQIEGEPVVAMLDDGSEVNIMPQDLWDRLNTRHSLSIRTDTPFRVSGIHGASQALLGHTEVRVTLGGLTTRHTFWVARGVTRLILGMPFFWKNRVDIHWSGDRRVVKQNTEHGQTLQYMHLPGGPKKTLYDPHQRKRVIVRQAEVTSFPILVEDDPAIEETAEGTVAGSEPEPGKAYGDVSEPDLEEQEGKTEVNSLLVQATSTGSIQDEVREREIQWAAEVMADHIIESPGGLELDVRMAGSHIQDTEDHSKGTATAISYGAYKSVSKKKRPVETIYPEVDKIQMSTPPDILADLPSVPKNPCAWCDLPSGKRLTTKRLEEALKAAQAYEGF